jgi:hypothetical protein
VVKQSLRGLFLAAIVLALAPRGDARMTLVPAPDADDASVGTGAPAAWTATSPGTFAYSIFTLGAAGLSAGTSFQYAFESARVGGTTLPMQPGVSPSLDAAGAAVFDRGAGRERYVAMPGGVEQCFDFDALPAGGDLVVRGVVTGAEFDASRSDGTVMTYGAYTLSNAIAIDAAGATLPLTMAHVAGGLEITLAAAWLATAAFPITVDPFVTAATSFDAPGATTLPIRSLDVAYNATANEYFIVYSYTPPGGANHDVYGRRINATTGAPIGTPIAIEVGTFASREPVVAWNSTNNTYLCAFADATSATTTHQIRGRILNASGADTGAGKFDISTVAGAQELWPDVAFDGTNYLVAWGRQNLVSAAGDFNVHAQRVSSTGTAVGAVLNLETGTADSRRICTAYLGGAANTYLVAWSEATTTATLGALRGRTVSTGGVLGTVNTYSTNAAQDHDWPRASAGNAANEFVVVWDSGPSRNNSPQSAPSPDLNFRRVSSAGVGLGAAMVPIATASTGAGLADVAWSPFDNDYVFVWTSGVGFVAPGQSILLARVDAGTDTILENNTVVSAVQDDLMPAIAARTGSTECLIAWVRLAGGSFSFFERIYQTSIPPVPPGGGGSTGRDNPNGNQLFNDTLCGGTATTAAAGWLALGLAALLLLALARR